MPTQTFPQITSSTASFTNAGYNLVTFSGTGSAPCTSAYNYIKNTGAGTWATSGFTNIVIRIVTTSGDPCSLSNANNDTITVRGNLAIVSDGGFNLNQRSNWNGASAPVKNVYFISTYPAAFACTNKNISVEQQHELRCLHQRVLLHALHGDDGEHERLLGTGARGERLDRQPVHDDVHAGAGAGLR